VEYGDLVIVNHPRHPFYNYIGKIVGRRGKKAPDDVLMLVLINNKSYIIPQSMLSIYNPGTSYN
jgi:hypothetical protein